MRLYQKKPSGIWYLEVERGKAFSLGTRDKEEAIEIAAPQLEKAKAKCAFCKKEIKGRVRKFCSRQCRILSQAETVRFGARRADILGRLGPECYFCKTPESLVVHHIDGNGANRKRGHKNNDPDNFVVLCESCHRKLHILMKKSGVCEEQTA